MRSKHDGSTYSLLRRPAAPAAARARERLEALKPHITPELDAVLRSFLAAVEKACAPRGLGKLLDRQRVLVFNTHRFESTRAELIACIGWFDTFAAKGYSARLATRAESIFDPCDGLDFDEDDRKLDVGDPDALCGWPSSVTDWAPPVVPKPPERHEKLLADERVHRPFRRARTFHRGLPVEVEWNAAPGDPLVGHPAWSTVESVIFSGPVALLPPVRQLQATPALIRAIDRPVPYVSICMSDDKDPAAWAALESTERFPNLVEVRVVAPATVWLPEAGQRLIARRPSVRLHAGSPLVPLPPLTPLTAEEHAARIARWTNPPEARFLEGPRYDNGFS
ncbi:hypothetical protein [Polyangium sp. 15x6]|uniref:hypothetical protein n=1 Tax=Polyangium sp. 15x6 TaxID=3042687 RepID=UPI00249B1B37|nr:hypothetical protein [Polyangium sp. 15x6]MDI3288083.1 hypothetical protein [Polyangium sp. 15x6]